MKNIKKIKTFSEEDAHLAYKEAEKYLGKAIRAFLKLPKDIPYNMIIQITAIAEYCHKQQPPPPMDGEGI